MRVPPADIGECDLQTDISLDELRDLQQTLAELRLRIVGAVSRHVFLRIRRFEHLHRVEHLATRAVYELRRAGAIQRLQPSGLRSRRTHAELIETVHRHRFRRALEYPRRLWRERDRAERIPRALGARSLNREVSVEPAIGSSLNVRRAGLHVVLCIEVRPRRARAPHRVNRREDAAIVKRLEGCKRWMEPEEAIEV